ncbi:hypothetical protein FB451DRAFT_1186684 [Mycena latifolia]|nr:hypothetical protein FB451DRAFT_1186684 [Mycena latifolia]
MSEDSSDEDEDKEESDDVPQEQPQEEEQPWVLNKCYKLGVNIGGGLRYTVEQCGELMSRNQPGVYWLLGGAETGSNGFSEFYGDSMKCEGVGDRENHPGRGFKALRVGTWTGKGRLLGLHAEQLWSAMRGSTASLRTVEGLNSSVGRSIMIPFPAGRKPNQDTPRLEVTSC